MVDIHKTTPLQVQCFTGFIGKKLPTINEGLPSSAQLKEIETKLTYYDYPSE